MRNRRNRYYQGPPSNHFDGERFFMPGHSQAVRKWGFLKWQLGSTNRSRWPRRVENRPHEALPSLVDSADIHVTFIGHATVLIQAAGVNILTDPFFSERASPLRWAGPKRVRPPGVPLDRLPVIDAVLVSHNHYDHMDLPSIRALHDRHRPLFITPLGNGAIMRRTGRPLTVREGDWGDRIPVGNDVAVTLAPAFHWSRRGAGDGNMALWASFLIETPGGPVYFAGDTGYGSGEHFRAVREQFGPVRLALLPIGAYEPRWFMHRHHMNPDDAVKAHLDLEAELSLGIHHSTLQLTDEGIGDPPAALARALAQRAMAPHMFRAFEPGEGLRIAGSALDAERDINAAAE
jgi:L-ascorbate metabolism protein UlaG (beta-lactamase superfamily)